ncbi:MAG: RHS repeat-associated core domain-containing protein, partial [Blastocatellia bacterium]|nr:RHS repeat-associated core domain-containing protein [Blastocatellia bacterium]
MIFYTPEFPYGDQIIDSVGNRASVFGYSTTDSIRQKFTTYERDDETGLDYAKARYYANANGRFMSIDPLGRSQQLEDPQTWNRYTYTLNNPINLTDPLGLEPNDKEKSSRVGRFFKAVGRGVAKF